LKQALATDKWEELEIFASDPFLGELLAQLSPDVKASLRATHALDWTTLSAHEIEERRRKVLKI
jgi:hypothetical protein